MLKFTKLCRVVKSDTSEIDLNSLCKDLKDKTIFRIPQNTVV